MENKIDVSVVARSQRVLCEFYNPNQPSKTTKIGFLKEVESEYPYFYPEEPCQCKSYTGCRIYSNPDYLISNADGKLVLPAGLIVLLTTRSNVEYQGTTLNNGVKMLDGKTSKILPFDFRSKHTPLDIISARILGANDGWRY